MFDHVVKPGPKYGSGRTLHIYMSFIFSSTLFSVKLTLQISTILYHYTASR